ncbi:MAG: hypothetical protein KDK70_24745, partial [Myxococcales bacterium]|nr:hypothetical protein [Myxococcales bacterium]
STIEATLVGPGPRRVRAREAVAAQWERLALLGLGGLVVVMSLALRAIRPVLAIVLALGSALAGMLTLAPPPGPYDVPLLVLLLGFGCEGALHLTRISPRGWPAAAVLGTALLPLWLSPYPAWRGWSIRWLLGLSVVILLLRLVVPALLALARHDTPPARRGVHLHPLRPLAVVLALAALGSGAWSLGQLPFLALDRTPLPEAVEAPARQVRERFFDPRLVVEARSTGPTPAAALERAAEHARQLTALVPGDATRVDSPGRFVLPPAELESRRRSLERLELPARMDSLRELLHTRGFRPDAFGEFLRGASDLEALPTPQAALEGPLGPWIRGYLTHEGDDEAGDATLVTRVHLHPDAEAPVPRIETDDGEGLPLRGPAVAARRDHQGFADWLGIYVACQLWLGALAVWLSTRSLPAALGCSCAALTAITAALALMVPLGVPLGPALLPALLLVGAAAMVAGGRACQAMRRGRRMYATGVLLSGLCQAVAGLTLFASRDPLWAPMGLLVAVGSVVASGAGLFVAPGLMHVLGGKPPPPAPPQGPALEPKGPAPGGPRPSDQITEPTTLPPKDAP